MKHFIAIGILLLQFAASWAGPAKPVVFFTSQIESKTYTGSELSSTSQKGSLDAENVHSQQSNFSSRKIRDYRLLVNAVIIQWTDFVFPSANFTANNIKSVPAGKSIKRLLLFPKHYFW